MNWRFWDKERLRAKLKTQAAEIEELKKRLEEKSVDHATNLRRLGKENDKLREQSDKKFMAVLQSNMVPVTEQERDMILSKRGNK